MSNRGKAFIMALVFLTIASAAAAVTLLYFWQQEKAKIQTLQETLEDLNTRQKVTQKQLEDAKKLAEQLDAQLQEKNKQNESLMGELEKEKRSRQDLTKESEQLKLSLQQKETVEQDLKSQLDEWQKKTKKLEVQLKNIDSEKAELERKIKEAESAKTQNVELGKIIVGQEAPGSTAPTTASPIPIKEGQTKAASVEGKILVVNKDYDFVVINLGSRDGVGLGDTFSVYRKNKYIGDIKAEKIHESMSAASFVSTELKDKINEGDKIVFKGK